MKRKIELLAPGGDVDAVKSAILAGADAVYCGLHAFNARNRAANIEFEDLQGLLRLAHQHNCQIFLTLNIILFHSEFPAVFKLLNRLVNTSIDGIIVQDLGLFYLLSKYFPTLKVHASTQVTTHNEGQIGFLKKLNVERVNLSRELNLSEIKALSEVAHQNQIDVEAFVHGSYCISFSGLCYMSSVHGGRSGNRGRCSQPCRENYLKTEKGIEFPLNLKDNSAFDNVQELYDAGVDSFKIEGRIKEFDYVHTIVCAWRKQLDTFISGNNLIEDKKELYKVFNRDFTNAFLVGDLNNKMFIDNPMSQSGNRLFELSGCKTNEDRIEVQQKLYKEKEELKAKIQAELDKCDIAKIPINIIFSGTSGFPMKVVVETPEQSYTFYSFSKLAEQGTKIVDRSTIESKLNAINETEYYIENIELCVEGDIYLPFSDIKVLRKEILFALNGEKDFIAPVSLPALNGTKSHESKLSLSVIIADKKDLFLGDDTSTKVYFQLPNSLNCDISEYVALFQKHKNLIPWFPAILIGDDYLDAVEFLLLLQPEKIVTNNTGIANEACELGISWIAGPYLNITNSYSLLALKEKLNCCGAFISNEVSKQQIKLIRKPEEFQLFFSIYHPLELMTSRACFFRTVKGCDKPGIDKYCLSKCVRSSTISNVNEEVFYIDKQKGCLNQIYSEANLLNTDIITDIPDKFDSFFIDLRAIKTKTKIHLNTKELISAFKNFIEGDKEAGELLKQNIYPANNTQYNARII